MSCGNVSLTVLIVNLSMIIPILVSVFCYGERLSVLRFFGILLTVFALFLSIDSRVEKRNFRKWFCLSILSSLFSGGLAVCQKIFSKTEWHTHSKPFVVCGYAVATIISILIYIIFKCKGTGISYKVNIKVIGYAASIGILLGTFQILNTIAITIIDGTLIFPAYYGGALILSYLSSLLSPDLRAAEKDLKELISDYHFLKENDIHTVSDLQANIDESKAQLSDLERERKTLSNHIRRPKSPEDENQNKEHRKEISKQMKPVRERLRRAEKILEKSPHLYELLKQEHELERKARARYLDRSR